MCTKFIGTFFIKGKMIIIDKKLNDKYALTTDEVANF
jgi:hypothetical protein